MPSRPPKLSPADFLSHEKSTNLPNGHFYTYYHFLPSRPVKDTIFLIHGFPDHAFTFRYLIPTLQTTFPSLQIVIPALLGYGATSAPSSPAKYSYKSLSEDILQLAQHLNLNTDKKENGGGIILGGHDWGGALVYRIALWQPSLIRGLFSISTPFSPPPSSPKSTFRHPAVVMPNWTYQLQFATQDFEDAVNTETQIRNYLNAMFGGRTSKGKVAFTASKGIDLALLGDIQQSPLLSKKEIDFYVQQFTISGMKGPLNWYRTHELNFNDEKEVDLAGKFAKEDAASGKKKFVFEIPTLFIAGTKDTALPPSMSKGMEKWWSGGKLVMEEVDANHWALWEKPEETNALIVGWLGKEFGLEEAGGKSKL